MARLVYFLRLTEHGYKVDKKIETPHDEEDLQEINAMLPLMLQVSWLISSSVHNSEAFNCW